MVILGKEAYKAARKMTIKKLKPMKQVFLNIAKNKKEKCVYCNSITPYNKHDKKILAESVAYHRAESSRLMNEILEQNKDVIEAIKKEEKEKCVLCGSITPYNKNDDISIRNYYVENAGQLCDKCFIDIYGDD